MSNYINKVLDKDQNEYPLRDERLPDAAPEDSGKVPVVNAEGAYELGLPASGTKLYKHSISNIKHVQMYGGGLTITRISDGATYLIPSDTVLGSITSEFLSTSNTPCDSINDTIKYSVLLPSEISKEININAWQTSVSIKITIGPLWSNKYHVDYECVTSGFNIGIAGPEDVIRVTDTVTPL